MRISVLIALLAAFPTVAFAAQKPAAKDPKVTLEALFAADRFGTGLGDIDKCVRELESIAINSPAEAKDWSAKLAKLWAKGDELEKKSGQHFFWEKGKEKKGLYIVGGETNRPKALVIAMHGGGAGSGDAWSAKGEFDGAVSKLDWLMICPEVLEKTEHGWTDSGSEEFVLQLVDAACRTWKIDRDRVYFSGHSMGGYGTWTLGAHHADRVAALAPSAGAPTPIFDKSGAVIDIAPGVIPSLRNVPIVIYQSDDDPRVPPATNRGAALKLDEAQKRWGGFVHEYWEVPNRQHEEAPGGMEALLAKIKDRKRDTHPTKVVWQPTLKWKRQFYWLWWDRPAANAIVVAECDKAKNEVHVTCDVEPKGLEVLLDDALVDTKKEVAVFLGEKEVFRGVPKADLGTLAKTWLTGDPALAFAVRVKLSP